MRVFFCVATAKMALSGLAVKQKTAIGLQLYPFGETYPSMPFQAVRNISLNAQIGPYATFAELQAAAAAQMPGCVVIDPVPNATSGEWKSANGASGRWTSPPFALVHPVSFVAYTGPTATFEELQVLIGREIPGAVLDRAAKVGMFGHAHVGAITDAQGRAFGEWQEIK